MIRIVIAEDQRMMLGALSSLLNLEEDMEVVGRASNGQEALTLVQEFCTRHLSDGYRNAREKRPRSRRRTQRNEL